MSRPDTAATIAQSRTLCQKSVALCAAVLSMTTPRGEPVLGDVQWRYWAERLAQAQTRLTRSGTSPNG